uniref:Uncharacterized protein n=1 Tax=Anguilla anguilla TaxID=7936 RepID=A0A0E9SF62_ANGAN
MKMNYRIDRSMPTEWFLYLSHLVVMVISPYWTCMDILGTVPRVNKTGNVTKKRT